VSNSNQLSAGAWLRLGGRTSAVVGSLLAHWVARDVDRLVHRSKQPADGTLATAMADQITFTWRSRWARQICSLYGLNVSTQPARSEQEQPYPGVDARGIGRVFIMNHRSGLDIFIGMLHFAGHFVSRADLSGWPLIGRAARTAGTLFVDRSSKASGASTMRNMIRSLKRGSGIILFPEATAYSGDEVRPFRVGAFKAAKQVDAEIVPVGVAYADPATTYGDESFLEHMQRVSSMKRIDIALQVGTPFHSQDRSVRELRDHAHETVQELVHCARARL